MVVFFEAVAGTDNIAAGNERFRATEAFRVEGRGKAGSSKKDAVARLQKTWLCSEKTRFQLWLQPVQQGFAGIAWPLISLCEPRWAQQYWSKRVTETMLCKLLGTQAPECPMKPLGLRDSFDKTAGAPEVLWWKFMLAGSVMKQAAELCQWRQTAIFACWPLECCKRSSSLWTRPLPQQFLRWLPQRKRDYPQSTGGREKLIGPDWETLAIYDHLVMVVVSSNNSGRHCLEEQSSQGWHVLHHEIIFGCGCVFSRVSILYSGAITGVVFMSFLFCRQIFHGGELTPLRG